MLRMIRSVSVVVVLGLSTIAALAQTAPWTIDPNHSAAQFTVRHMAISNVTGSFTKVSGTVELNEKDITQSQVSASIDVRLGDRKSTRLNSSHANISYAVFCLTKTNHPHARPHTP